MVCDDRAMPTVTGVRWVLIGAIAACGSSDDKAKPPAAEAKPSTTSAAGERETALQIRTVTVSSSQPPSAGYTFVGDNLIDASVATSWQPAKNAKGPHWIRLELTDEATITEVAIANGFQVVDRIGDEFALNRKIARAKLRFGDAGEIPIEFNADARDFVRFAVPRKRTRTVEILVEDTHPGTKWNDLAVSEVRVSGIVTTSPSHQEVASTNEWWSPPPGRRQEVEALAHGFAGIDESDLGAVFTSDLKRVHGAPSLFQDKPPRRVARDEMQHFVLKLRQRTQLDAGFNYLFIKAGTNQSVDRDYEIVRAMQVKEVVRVDESARMRRPPEEAVFYLAEIHKGASFDLLIEGDHASMGMQLDITLAKGAGALANVNESTKYRMKAFGLGLRDITGDGIFAMTPEQIAERYRTGEPVPVQLVFRTIPGRSYEPREIAVPQVVIDEPVFSLDENEGRIWNVAPGRYWVEATSRPNGMSFAWDESVRCDQAIERGGEYHSIKMNCTVPTATKLKVANPSLLGAGAAETMSMFLAKAP
jgi:hypothetical protein